MAAFWFTLLAAGAAQGLLAAADHPSWNAVEMMAVPSRLCSVAYLLLTAWTSLVRARPVARAGGWKPRVFALLGTNLVAVGLVFLRPNPDLPLGLEALSSVLMTVGSALALFTFLHLGSAFSLVPEAHRVITTGPYHVIRHPLYLAEMVTVAGIAIRYASLPMMLLFGLQVVFQVRRMENEERLLADVFTEYASYRQRTSRLLPGVW